MIRPSSALEHPRPFDFYRTVHKQPVETANQPVGARCPAAKGAAPAGFTEFGLEIPGVIFRVQIAREHDRRVWGIAFGIGKDLLQLQGLDAPQASAFQMCVVDQHLPVRRFEFNHERNAPANPPLRKGPIR